MIEKGSVVEKHSRKNIFLGSFLGYVYLALNIVSGLLFTPWISSAFGKSAYGIYGLSNSLISLFVMDFGLSMAANTLLSKYRSEGDEKKIERALSLIYKLYLLFDVVLFFVLVSVYFSIDSLYSGLSVSEKAEFKTVFIISGIYSVLAFPATSFDGVLSAYEDYIFLKVANIVSRILYISFTSIVIFLNLGITWLVIANSVSGLLVILLKYLFIRFHDHLGGNPFSHFSKEEITPFLSVSVWTALITIASRIYTYVSPSVLGIVSDTGNIAVLTVCLTVSEYVYEFGSIMNGLFLARITRIFSSEKGNSSGELMKLGVFVGKIQVILMSLILIGFVCCGREFLTIWMKDDATYSSAYWGVLLVNCFVLIEVPELVFKTALYAGSGIKQLAFLEIGVTALFVGLSFVFSYFYGSTGACIAICFSKALEQIGCNYLFHKFLKMDILSFFKQCYARPLIASVLSLSLGLCLHFFVTWRALPKFFLIGGSVTVVYCVATILFSFSKNDKLMYRSLFSSVVHKNEKNISACGFSPRTIVIGSCYPKEMDASVLASCRGKPNVSNVLYERKLLSGFENNGLGNDFLFLTEIPLGSYPRESRKIWVNFDCPSDAHIVCVHYVSLFGFLHFSKAVALRKQLLHFSSYPVKPRQIIISEAYLPYLKAVYLCKKHEKDIRVTLIVPDLPENISSGKRRGFLFRFLKKRYVSLTYRYIEKSVDDFVFFTQEMSENKHFQNKRYIVSNGIVEFSERNVLNSFEKTIVFAGTVDKNNGIPLLLKAFSLLKDKTCKLIVCGSGECSALVEEASKKNPRVIYSGFLNQDSLSKIMAKATVFVSPRLPNGTACLSFPSKVLAYASYRVPIVTFYLGCYGSNYDGILFYPKTFDEVGLAKAIDSALQSSTINLPKKTVEQLESLKAENVVKAIIGDAPTK